MDARCEHIEGAIVEAGGRLEILPQDLRRHVEACPPCAGLAEQERGLTGLLARAVAPRDIELEARIAAAVSRHLARRRLLALLPVAASLLVALFGVILLGGVPGGSLLALVPGWSTRTWLEVVAHMGDWSVALGAMSRSGSALVPGAALAAAGAVALAGVGGLTAVAVRWRRDHPW